MPRHTSPDKFVDTVEAGWVWLRVVRCVDGAAGVCDPGVAVGGGSGTGNSRDGRVLGLVGPRTGRQCLIPLETKKEEKKNGQLDARMTFFCSLISTEKKKTHTSTRRT